MRLYRGNRTKNHLGLRFYLLKREFFYAVCAHLSEIVLKINFFTKNYLLVNIPQNILM